MLIKSYHIIIYYNKIFKTTLEVQILLQHLSDMFQLIKNNKKKKTETKMNSPLSCAGRQVIHNQLSAMVKISHKQKNTGCKDF